MAWRSSLTAGWHSTARRLWIATSDAWEAAAKCKRKGDRDRFLGNLVRRLLSQRL